VHGGGGLLRLSLAVDGAIHHSKRVKETGNSIHHPIKLLILQ